MEIVEIPARGRALAVDLERVERLVPARVARRLEERERSVLKPSHERARIVDADRLDLAGEIVLALLDEGLGHRRHRRERSVQPQRRVDAVREQIAGDAAAGDGGVEAPEPLADLRQIARDRPVLQELRAIVEDASERSLVDEILQHRHGRHAAVVVPDAVRHFGRFDGVDHRLGLCRVPAERLLAHHHLAGARGGDRDLRVRVVRARDVDELDVLARDERSPVGLDAFVPPIRGERLHAIRVARADCLQHRLVRHVEETRRLEKRVRVRPPHEPVADQPDVQFLLHRLLK